MSRPPPPREVLRLEQISTKWSMLGEPTQFCLRYAPAIRAYAAAILKNEQDADDVAQDFLAKLIQHGLPRISPDRGRFRDYLKRSVRNAAISQLRKPASKAADPQLLAELQEDAEDQPGDDEAWKHAWKSSLLEQTWRALDRHQQQSPGNYCHTVLKVSVDFPDEDSEQLAHRVSQTVGKALRADAFRQQRSRARTLFAQKLVEEVSKTLDDPTRERVEEELIDLDLLALVRDHIPATGA